MLDRESSFAEEAIVELLKKSYVPLALDVWYEERRQDTAGELYRKVVHQRPGLTEGGTTQGFYVFAPDGKLLDGWNNRDPPKMKQKLRALLDSYRAPKVEKLEAKDDPAFARRPPEGGLVLAVHSRIVKAEWPPATDEWQRIHQGASGLDHLWITKREVEALARGEFPQSLTRRIVRFHFIDNTRGEPPMWQQDEVRAAKLELVAEKAGLVVTGGAKLLSADGDRGFDASVRGVLERKGDRITRLDLVARGEFFGQGTYTQGAPPGKFTLAIAFTLAGEGAEARVPPQGARELRDYLGE